ncbi:hypothetical protein [Halarchaeum sp. P4]|uniref:hypothetical protein n=1 Tax=Halarchaeum sp. P4 TaxID=3421639 RepID=UPI003EB89A6A
MNRPVLRAALCLLVGSFTGQMLGPLFAPDPTGFRATALTVGITAVVGFVLYRSDWLQSWQRDE